MYYAFDVIPHGDSFKIIDVQGTTGAGIHEMRTAYGRPEARERTKRYVAKLTELAKGKIIVYGHPSPTAYVIHGMTKEASELYKGNRHWKPLLHWRRDAAAHYRRREKKDENGFNWSRQELRILHQAALDLGADIAFGQQIYFNGDGTFHMLHQHRDPDNPDEKASPIQLDSVGLYYHRGSARNMEPHFVKKLNPDIKIVNPPDMDRAMECKWYFQEFAEMQGFEDAFPRSIPVGMGLATYDQAREFVSQIEPRENWPLVVLKPTMTYCGYGIRMISPKNVEKNLRKICVKSSDPELEDFIDDSVVLPHWLEFAESDKCSLLSDPKTKRSLFSPGWDLWENLERRSRKVKSQFEKKWEEVNFEDPDSCGYTPRFFPIFEYASGSLEEFVPPGIVQSRKTGKQHAGYIRVVVFDRQSVLAMWRLQKESYEDEYQQFVGPNCRTFWEGCDEETEAKLIDFLNPVIEGFESEFFSRIHSVNDLFKFRNRYLKGLLRAAR